MPHDESYDGLADQFMDLIGPKRAPKNVIDNTKFIQAFFRWERALEYRVINDPEMLALIAPVADRLSEIISTTVAVNALRHERDDRSGASAAECGRVLGMTKQGASKRKADGITLMLARLAQAGVIRLADHWDKPAKQIHSETAREKHAIATAQEFAVARMDEYRARHQRRAS